jgi:hypothetical protein
VTGSLTLKLSGCMGPNKIVSDLAVSNEGGQVLCGCLPP